MEVRSVENFNQLQSICLHVFQVVSKTTDFLVLPLFMMRVVFSSLLGEGRVSFQIIKGAILYFILITGFPYIIDILFSIPETYLPHASSLNSISSGAPEWSSASLIPFSVDRVLEVILAGLYWIAYYMHVFFMMVMCSMAPIIFLSSTLLGLGFGLELFLGLLLIGSSWPLIWYGFNEVHQNLMVSQIDGFGAKCLEILITLLKGISPLAFAAVAINSPPGKIMTKTMQGGVSSGRWVGKSSLKQIQAGKTSLQTILNSGSQERSLTELSGQSYMTFIEKNSRLMRAQMQHKNYRKNVQGEGVQSENPRPGNT